MSSPTQITNIDLEKLNLDIENPRLPISIKKSGKVSSIVDWMLLDASIIELMLAIGQSGFFVGEALLVVPVGDGSFTVIEGNRRLTSLKILSDPDLASVQKNKIATVMSETTERPVSIPCIIFSTRDEITKYLGYRHVTGIKSWGVLAKARYLSSMFSDDGGKDFSTLCRDLAKSIGSRSDYVKKLLVAYKLYMHIEDLGFYKISNLNETTFHFNYLSDSLTKKNIREYIGLKEEYDISLSGLKSDRVEILTKWFFEKDQGKSRVLGTSADLKKLDEILGDYSAREYFEDGKGSLSEAYDLFSASADSFHNELLLSLKALKRAKSYEHMIEQHHGTDVSSLREIFNLCKSMKASIESKGNDDGDF